MSSIILNFLGSNQRDTNFILAGSKSMSQRSLIINNLMSDSSCIDNLSTSLDTAILKNCIRSKDTVKNVFNSGTSLRFLISFYALRNQPVVIMGDTYLFTRPIDLLIRYLNSLGANIVKRENTILIKFGKIRGGAVNIDFAY